MNIELVSDDVLDGMRGGWTPTLVRTLVERYRELKQARAGVDTFCEHAREDVQNVGDDYNEWCSRCGAYREGHGFGPEASWSDWMRPKGPR